MNPGHYVRGWHATSTLGTLGAVAASAKLLTLDPGETRHALAQAQHRLRSAVGRLDSLSPLAVLGRGYSLTRTPTGEIVRSARQVSVGDDVRVLLHQGTLDCRVAATKEQDDRPQV